jgi:hypothetical protein
MNRFMPAKAASSATVTADVNALVGATLGLRIMGWSCKETAGVPAAATFRIMNGETVGAGTVVANVNLALSSSQTVWLDNGVECPNGITIDFLTGQFDVTVYFMVL